MHTNAWVGILLILFAILTSFGITFGVLPLLGSGITVLVAIAGTWLYIKSSHR